MSKQKAILALKSGLYFEGYSFGAKSEVSGEVVFNTSMAGYQEILTDPSYKGQMVTMTYTEIGNYGTNSEDEENSKPVALAMIVKNLSLTASNFRSESSLSDYMAKNNVTGIYGIDTRALTRHIRHKGAVDGIISTTDLDPKSLVEKAKAIKSIEGADLAKEVTCNDAYSWNKTPWVLGKGYEEVTVAGKRPKVVCYDFGVKRNILNHLVSIGFDVTVVPASYDYKKVLDLKPDGVFLSNGPGDPSAVTYAIDNIRNLLNDAPKLPVFGICLGHQILSLALGGATYKLKFGHRGGNQPVKDLSTGKIEITSQNHGFAVHMNSLGDDVEVTHVNLNDNTVEGIKLKDRPVFSVQYHPESSPGPHDSQYLFGRFMDMVRG